MLHGIAQTAQDLMHASVDVSLSGLTCPLQHACQVIMAVAIEKQRLPALEEGKHHPGLAALIGACMERQPELRPTFDDLVCKLAGMQAAHDI